ncbi:MAG TPA: glycosyltransferase family 4 protein, partial [Longimicrobiales bacterium]|nr:glycosyltransferase family 4 protein [Longimicrobiales bacterium]
PVGWIAHALGSVPRVRERARDADVIHAQAFASVVPAAAARRVRGAPLVTTYHTSHFLRRAEQARWRPVLSRLIRTADHNLAASREIADVAERLAPGVEVEALTNGVDTEVFRPGEAALPPGSRRRLVVPRRLFAKNGVEFLVRAMPRIMERVDAEAMLVGDGPERARLEALARDLDVADRVTFLGARANDEMPGLLRSGEVAVFPSLMEATSVAALESMACGVPVAASRVGGLPEIVDETVGALFEPADPASLADTVVALLEADDLAERGRRARARVVERWSNDRLARRHLEVYEGLLDGSRSRAAG